MAAIEEVHETHPASREDERRRILEEHMTDEIRELLEETDRLSRMLVRTWNWPKYKFIISGEGTFVAGENRYTQNDR